ncbi:MAG: hypothetical protein AW08_02491 [Candidatus Accumulibacter adjunctus]|uniref:Uncharacterized protein n=1 Tax=Candidatus Accumulibacter adjunctus TaxID=1454001 RepID=A0A011MVI1_9PROT|nr:MAG: hypothetical protein AW08_02491 [Candidatus Accumulibacter adjunctus]
MIPHPRSTAICCLAGIGLALPALAGPTCADPAIIAPAARSTQSSLRPTIVWQAVAGVSSYRLKLVSREPEGQTFLTIDTLVSDTRFTPPQALGNGYSLVTLRVASECPERAAAVPASSREHRFLIDASSACAVTGLVLEPDGRRIRRAATGTAERYEVFAYDPTDGRLLLRQETSAPTLLTPMAGASPVIAAVRAHCGDVVGRPAYLAY